MTPKIYTKTGDKGKTSLVSGRRLSKAHYRIDAYGTVDELNSFVGFLKESIENPFITDTLIHVQRRLFSIGSCLASDPTRRPLKADIREADIRELENGIDTMEQELPELMNFILPGGNKDAAIAHLCRTVCRRAERRVVALAEESEVQDEILSYINRLSDYFFIVSRFLVHKSGDNEIIWTPREKE